MSGEYYQNREEEALVALLIFAEGSKVIQVELAVKQRKTPPGRGLRVCVGGLCLLHKLVGYCD